MKKIKILHSIFGLAMLFTACTPDTYELGRLLDKSELKFTITPLSSNPNELVLTSSTPNATPLWVTPAGRSIRVKDTINIAFPGTYKIVYGAETAGGYVQADTTTIVITTTDPDLQKKIHNPMWKNLTGGLSSEKTWYLDLDANGVSKYWTGPQYYYGTNDSWTSVTDGVSVGGDSWNWCPNYSQNTWLMAAVNFGSMTFNLKKGFNVSSDHTSTTNGLLMGGKQSGTYLIDTLSHTFTLSDATLIHPIEYNGKVKTWSGTFKIFSLTANSMQVAVLRDPTLSGEGACYYVYNFVSKDYYDAH